MTLESQPEGTGSRSAGQPAKPANAAVEGGCLCGQVRYRAKLGRARVLVCHCRACQKQSGSAFSVVVTLATDDLHLEGELATFVGTADSGHIIHRRFCPACGSPVLTVSPEQPGRVALKAGTLDDPRPLVPRLHIWCENAQPWVTLPTDTACLPRQS